MQDRDRFRHFRGLNLHTAYSVIFNTSIIFFKQWHFLIRNVLGNWNSIPRRSEGYFSHLPLPDLVCGSLCLLSKGYRGDFSLGVKRPDRKADNSLLSNTKLKKDRLYISSTTCFIARCLRSRRRVFPSDFLIDILYVFLTSPIHKVL